MPKTVQIRTISLYHAIVWRSGISFGARKRWNQVVVEEDDEPPPSEPDVDAVVPCPSFITLSALLLRLPPPPFDEEEVNALPLTTPDVLVVAAVGLQQALALVLLRRRRGTTNSELERRIENMIKSRLSFNWKSERYVLWCMFSPRNSEEAKIERKSEERIE